MIKEDNKIITLMVLTIMQASKKFKNNRLLRIFHKNEWYYEDFCEVHESTKDERILDRCTRLSVGVFR